MLKKCSSAGLLVLLVLACVPDFSQSRFEIQPFVGYKFGGSTPVQSNVKLPVALIDSLNFDSSVNDGVSVGVNATDILGFEFLWNRQPTKAVGTLSTGQTYDQKIDVNIDQYHGNLLIHLTDYESKLMLGRAKRSFREPGGRHDRLDVWLLTSATPEVRTVRSAQRACCAGPAPQLDVLAGINAFRRDGSAAEREGWFAGVFRNSN